MTALPPCIPSMLAQASRPAAAANRLWQTVGVALLLVVAGVVLVVLAFWLKRQLFGGPTATAEPLVGFTPSDLRRLRAQGKMTEAEYERARAKLVEPHRRRIAEEAGEEREADTRTKDVDLIRDAE